MDFGASFHATYCKEELERFKLCFGKVRLADDKTLDIASVRDVVLKTSFGSLVVARGNNYGSLYMVEVHLEGIGAIIDGSGSAALWFGEAEESFLHNVREDKETAEVGARVAFYIENGIVILKMVPETPLQFGIAERLSRTFRAESTGLRAEAPKIGSDEMRYSFRDMKSHQVIRSRDITFTDSNYGARCATYSSSLTKPMQKSQVLADPTLQVPLDEIRIDAKLNFVEEHMEILEREFKKLKRSRIAIIKVR
ncbi:hypothetical protein Tco_0500031 [Tanacetum coccineum]